MKTAPKLLAATMLFVAGCGDDPAPPPVPVEDADDQSAKGDVLGGTITDAMLPMDRLQSQSPPLMDTSSSDGAGDRDETDETEEAGGSDDADPGEAAATE